MSSNTPAKPATIARRAAMDLLARREHSYHELLQKLVARFPDYSVDEILQPAVALLRTENLQSDARFLEAVVNHRSTRGVGPLKITAELQPRKLDRDLVKAALYGHGPDWEALCMDVLQRKFRGSAKPSAQERMRWQRFLQQRGFGPEHIRAAVRARMRSSETAADHDD